MPRRARQRSAAPMIIILVVVVGLLLAGGAVAALMVYRAVTSPPVAIPERYRALVLQSAARCPRIPVEVFAAQLAVESGWDPRAQSPAGALGIAQFMPGTWAEYGSDNDGDGEASVWNPADAIPSAAELNCVNWQLVRSVPGDRLANTLAAYNAGFSAVRKYDGIPPFPETQAYVRRILELAPRIKDSEGL